MKEIRFHGRGGQGVVTAAEILAAAAFKNGKYAQAFPYFGPERRGAPTTAFTRIDDKPIRTRSQVRNPDYVVVQDSSLFDVIDVLDGLKNDGLVLINSNKSPKDFKVKNAKVYAIDATSLAEKILRVPFVNTIILGALAAVTNEVTLESVKAAVKERLAGKSVESNIRAVEEAYKLMKGSIE